MGIGETTGQNIGERTGSQGHLIFIPPDTDTNYLQVMPSGLTGSGPVVIDGQSDVIVTGLNITNGSGPGVLVSNSTNVIIDDSEIHSTLTEGVRIVNSTNVTTQNCYIHDTGDLGIYGYQSNGFTAYRNRIDDTRTSILTDACDLVNVTYNKMHTIWGTYDAGGWNAFIQIAYATGGGNRINYNKTFTPLGTTDVGDKINLWECHGDAGDPMQVNYNSLINSGPRVSGTGFLLGDGGSTYMEGRGNRLVNAGAAGCGIAGGQNCSLIDNLIFGEQLDWSNVGLYVWDQYASSCSGHTVSGNRVNWTDSTGVKKGFWDGGNCGSIAGSGNDWDDLTVTAAIANFDSDTP